MGAAPQGASILLRSMALLTSAGAWACDGPRPLLDSAHHGADRRVAQALNPHDNPIMQEQTGELEHPALDLPHYMHLPELTVDQEQHALREDEASASSEGEATGNATWAQRFLLGEVPLWEREWVRSAWVLENWFCEGRATSLATSRVVQAIRLRHVEAYEGWTGPAVTWLSQWAPHFDGLPSSSTTPVVLYISGLHRWSDCCGFGLRGRTVVAVKLRVKGMRRASWSMLGLVELPRHLRLRVEWMGLVRAPQGLSGELE